MIDVAKTDLFRKNVRDFCRLRGITQGKLARRADLSQEWLSTMLTGKSNPTLPVCERIAKALETSLEALLAEPEPPVLEAEKASPVETGVDVL